MLQDDTVLLIGWADCIKVAVVRTRGWDGLTGTLGPGTKYVEIRTSLNTDYYVSGLAPFGDQLVVLAYLPDKDDNAAESISTAFPTQVLNHTAFLSLLHGFLSVLLLRGLLFYLQTVISPQIHPGVYMQHNLYK